MFTLAKLSTFFYLVNYIQAKKLEAACKMVKADMAYLVFSRNLTNTTIPCQTLCKIGTEPGSKITNAIRKIKSFLMTLNIEYINNTTKAMEITGRRLSGKLARN
jgi:hypothetical protein